MSTRQQKYQIYTIAIIALLIDQFTKIIVREGLDVYESIKLINGVFHLTHTENTGAAFSLFTGQVQILSLISLIAIVVISWWVLSRKEPFDRLEIIAWGVLLGGTTGNMIDRILSGSVTDFFDFTLINFPVFNFADVFIDTGAALIIIHAFLSYKNDQHSTKNNNT
jgi:signal peptidase II